MNKNSSKKVATRKVLPLRKKDQAAVEHPYSAIPRDYFSRIHAHTDAAGDRRTLLSIQSSDGREVLAVNAK